MASQRSASAVSSGVVFGTAALFRVVVVEPYAPRNPRVGIRVTV
jgi:hypothetical protein